MCYRTELSIEYANQRSYLDDLFHVYPTIPDGIRELDDQRRQRIDKAFKAKDNESLVTELLKLELFPIKDSYVAYLKRDIEAIKRNPNTINRLSGRLYEMGLPKILERSTEPKETNRQIWPLFKRRLDSGALGVVPVDEQQFLSSSDNAILKAGDAQLMTFARKHLNYTHEKGLDFIGRFNGKYVIGEAKFLTDFWGHQNAQFNDAISTILSDVNAVKVAILDGVVYIKGNNKLYRQITTEYKDHNIMSALVLREFLYQL